MFQVYRYSTALGPAHRSARAAWAWARGYCDLPQRRAALAGWSVRKSHSK